MIVIHGAGHHSALTVWAENARDPSVSPATEAAGAGHLRAHPFAVDSTRLAEAVRSVDSTLRPTARRVQPVTMWLPTRDDAPAPSSALIAAAEEGDVHTHTAPWVVPGIRLDPRESVALLRAASRDGHLAAGTFAGADLRYWAEAFRFAAEMVVRQRFLPGSAHEVGGTRAIWEPVFTGDDGERLVALSARMPGAARALTGLDDVTPPDWPAAEILGDAVATLVDHLVRSAITTTGRTTGHSIQSAHDAWLNALNAADGRLPRGVDTERLDAQIVEWRRPIATAARSPFRLCFRLEEPDADQDTVDDPDSGPADTWYVRYLLQPYADPSLLIPAAAGWDGGVGTLTTPAYVSNDAREFLLSGLGQAAGISTHVAASLEDVRPDGFSLDMEQAHDFLSEEALALQEAGFGVLLPSWWTGRDARSRLTARATVRTPQLQAESGILSLDTIADVDWDVALGDEHVTMAEIEALARMKAPLVRLRGRWVALSSAEIQEAIGFWKAQGGRKPTLRDIVRMEIGAAGTGEGVDIGAIDATGPIGELLAQLRGDDTAFADIAPPEAFVGTLRPYQVRGYAWLWFLRRWGLGGCLADDMGLGKTIQTLALVQRAWETGDGGSTLLVCPTSVINNWRKEAERFTPDLPVLVHHGPRRARGDAFHAKADGYALVLTSYGLLQRDIEFLRERPWRGITLDEAQYIKNPETAQARAAHTLKADYRFALTGTPVENHIGDLWSIMEFLNPGFLGTAADFKRDFFIPIQVERDEETAQRLRRATGPFMLRRLKTDRTIIQDLPEKMEGKVYCALTGEQASLYRAVLLDTEEALLDTEGIERRGLVLAALTKLTQICNHPAQFLGDRSAITGRSGKLGRLTEMIDEVLASGERALIFSRFVAMGEILQQHLQETFGTEVAFLHGGVPKARRDHMVDRFQSPGGPRIFMLSLRAGGTGLNLTAANHVFHFDRWWNPAVENQATDRAYRIGQERNVQVHKFICAGTLEDHIDEMIDRKREIAEQVVGTGEGWLTELSNDELRDVLALSRDAVRG